MVAFVIVCHCASLAQAIAEEAGLMAPDVPIIPAGGTRQGGIGTDYELITQAISKAIEQTGQEEGVIILMDLGSAVLTTQLAVEEFEDARIIMADCPIVEGAIAGVVLAQAGAGIEAIMNELELASRQKKLQ